MQSLSSVQERSVSPGNWLKATTREDECNTSNTRGILMVRNMEIQLNSSIQVFTDDAHPPFLLHGISLL